LFSESSRCHGYDVHAKERFTQALDRAVPGEVSGGSEEAAEAAVEGITPAEAVMVDFREAEVTAEAVVRVATGDGGIA
jgi:hypothetical protein